MPSWSTIALFLSAGLVLVVIPGPNVLYIVARSLRQGRTAGVVAAFGVEAGTLVHVVAATLGLSALLVSSSAAFAIVKYAGAAYLLYLGVRTLLARDYDVELAAPPPMRLRHVFRQGVVVNVLNPKTALFFLAFLPQFVDPDRGSVVTQTLILGVLLTALGTLNDVVYALLAGGAGNWLKGTVRRRAAERWLTGSIYLGLGVTTALAGSESTT